MPEPIEHRACVVTIKSLQTAVVRFDSENNPDACASCRISNICGAQDQNFELEASCAGHKVEPGQEVIVAVSGLVRRRAVAYLFLLPLIVMVAVAVVFTQAGFSEPMVALTTLSVLVITMLIMLLFRKKINSRPVWKIVRICN